MKLALPRTIGSHRAGKGLKGEMKNTALVLCTGALFVIAAFAQHSHSATSDDQAMHSHHPTGDADGTPGVITGYVRDFACLLRNPEAGIATTPMTQDCLTKCVRGGSPIGILTEEGLLYLPISHEIPDKSVRTQLLPYTGKYVRASGRLFERGGLHAIAIEEIKVVNRPADSKIPSL
jgi:hypothetical protein